MGRWRFPGISAKIVEGHRFAIDHVEDMGWSWVWIEKYFVSPRGLLPFEWAWLSGADPRAAAMESRCQSSSARRLLRGLDRTGGAVGFS